MKEELYLEGDIVKSEYSELVVLVTKDQVSGVSTFFGEVIVSSSVFSIGHRDSKWVNNCFKRTKLGINSLEKILNQSLDELENKL